MPLLRYGDKGVFVRYLQLALKRAGYKTGEIDGIYGRRTLAALTAFQQENGLAADGIAGRLTWSALYPYLAGYRPHVTASGDSYYKLAKRYGTSVTAIERANPSYQAANLPVGVTLVIPLDFSVVSFEVPYSSALTRIVLDGLAARYPFIHLSSIGVSVMGKKLHCAALGTGGREIACNASHHANEWITTPLTLRFLEEYTAAVAADGLIYGFSARALYEATVLYITPLVDPDGVDLVTGALPKDDSWYRQAEALAAYYPSIPFPNGWKANIVGVDLNLGYPAGWEEARRIKFAAGYTRPGPRDYVGTAPLTEPENIAMYEFTLAHDFRLTLSYHTQGSVIYWKYDGYEPARSRVIADAFAQASGYLVEDTPFASGNAGYKDWFIQTYDLPGYTIEAGRGVSPLPLSDLPKLYRENEGIFALALLLSAP